MVHTTQKGTSARSLGQIYYKNGMFIWYTSTQNCFRDRQIPISYQTLKGAFVVIDLQLPLQSVPITTKVVSSNPVHGEMYSIQHYVKKLVSWLATGRWFTPVSSTNKADRYDMTEILLKVALNTITITSNPNVQCF
jgi:hypothetical protein